MLISVKEATQIVHQHLFQPVAEDVDLFAANGRILAEPIVADRPFPPFDRVMMDGFALNRKGFDKGNRRFRIEQLQAAGAVQTALADPINGCIEIMTGAVLPDGCDIVIPYEQVELLDQTCLVQLDEVKDFMNIHREGSDRREGDELIQSGVRIGPAEIGVMATVGKTRVKVIRQPKVAILSTGDELVEVSETPLPHQIRRSNVYMLQALVEREIGPASIHHINDETEEVQSQLDQLLDECDVILLSGGVSKGKFDLIPEILEKLGVVKLFHRVKQRPGKPFWFGSGRSTQVFAFPGNPVSTFMCSVRYFIPWWKNSIQQRFIHPEFAELTEDFFFKPDLDYFLQVSLSYGTDGIILASPVAGQGSGDLANLCDVEAFLELESGRNEFKQGESFPLWRFRNHE